jgi:hypothetical protein
MDAIQVVNQPLCLVGAAEVGVGEAERPDMVSRENLEFSRAPAEARVFDQHDPSALPGVSKSFFVFELRAAAFPIDVGH